MRWFADEPDPDFPNEDNPYSPGIGLVGHAGSYWAYDIEDPRGPAASERRAPGFVTVDDFVRGGVVYEYKRKRRKRR